MSTEHGLSQTQKEYARQLLRERINPDVRISWKKVERVGDPQVLKFTRLLVNKELQAPFELPVSELDSYTSENPLTTKHGFSQTEKALARQLFRDKHPGKDVRIDWHFVTKLEEGDTTSFTFEKVTVNKEAAQFKLTLADLKKYAMLKKQQKKSTRQEAKANNKPVDVVSDTGQSAPSAE